MNGWPCPGGEDVCVEGRPRVIGRHCLLASSADGVLGAIGDGPVSLFDPAGLPALFFAVTECIILQLCDDVVLTAGDQRALFENGVHAVLLKV